VFILRTVLILLVSALVFAPITGYIAYNYGRSFWRWFAVGMVLPFVSVFIALGMAMREKWLEEKAEQQRRMPPLP
jgi:heme exporter protein D